MQFIVLGHDGTDADAPARRQGARPTHLQQAQERFDRGEWLYAAAILEDSGAMIGSMIVCDYPSREDLQERWLKTEPYVTGGVWTEVVIRRAQVASHPPK